MAHDAGASDAPIDIGPLAPISLRVATWNVENFFDETDDPDKEDMVFTRAEVEQKIRDLARVLRALDADVVALQEVENVALLQRLAMAVPDLGYVDWHASTSFDPRGINVGYLSRYRASNVVSHVGARFPSPATGEEYFFTRDAYELFIEPGGFSVGIMNLHLRSRSGDGGDDRRLAEAAYARRIAERRVEVGTPRVLIVGDLNDEPGTPPVRAIVEGDFFHDVTLAVPADARWTFVFGGRRLQLDYVFANATVADERANVRILQGPEVDVASDHNPIVAEFLLQP